MGVISTSTFSHHLLGQRISAVTVFTDVGKVPFRWPYTSLPLAMWKCLQLGACPLTSLVSAMTSVAFSVSASGAVFLISSLLAVLKIRAGKTRWPGFLTLREEME